MHFLVPTALKLFLYDNRDGVYVYSAETGRIIYTLSRSYGVMNSVGLIHSDNQRMISANDYESFFVCGLNKGDTLAEIPFDKPYLMNFSPNGKYIAASSTQLFTQVFDATSYKLLYTLKMVNSNVMVAIRNMFFLIQEIIF
ncbi:MAG: hypothetical protein IPG07_05380 [Crocinitomicaceae bacterium]|nr:hypothetical protein [Crocinitomicaceae bacterium]